MAVLGVTGARGFIGTEFVELARSLGHQLRLFSRAGGGAGSFDLTGHAINPALLQGCDCVIHLAAQLPFEAPEEVQARACWEANALGTLKLMQAMREAGVRRLIHTTSANAYAAGCEFPDEHSNLSPRSSAYYLGSKIMQEIYATAYGAKEGIRVSCLRISSAYGPSERSLVGRFAAALLKGEALRLENGGRFGADFVHVSDVARAILLIEGLGEEGVWNVASGQRTTLLTLVTTLSKLTGADRSLVEIEPDVPGSFEGYPPINLGKIARLGFAPTDLEAGLQSTLDGLKCSSSDRAQKQA